MSNSALITSYSDILKKASSRVDPKNKKPGYAKFGHQMYNVKIPYQSSLPSAPFTGTQSQIEFEIKAADNYYLLNDDSIWLYMKVTEGSSGTGNSITPNFAECLFDRNNAFEWLMNGSRGLNPPYSMLQTILHPAVEMSQSQYEQLCNVLNHNVYLAHGSQTAILSGQTAVYFIRVPNPLPDDGFWLGALKSSTLRLRVRTQGSGTAIYSQVNSSGTASLSLTDMQLCMYCAVLHQEEIPAMRSKFSNFYWTKSEGRLYEPSSFTLAATGDINGNQGLQLQGLKDIPVKFIVGILHTSRSFTSTSDYWNMVELPKTARIYIGDRSGVQILSSNSEFYAEQRYTKGPKLFADSKFFLNFPAIYFNYTPNLQSVFHVGAASAEGLFWMTGDEYVHIIDSGLTTSGVYLDVIAFYESKWTINSDGNITSMNNI